MFWVVDGEISVDTDQLLRVAETLRQAADLLGQIALDAATAATVGEDLGYRYPASHGSGALARESAVVKGAAEALEERLVLLALWHARAAWIFAGADGNAVGMFTAAGVSGDGGWARFGLLSDTARWFPPLAAGLEAAGMVGAVTGAVTALTTDEEPGVLGGLLLQRELSRIGAGLASVPAGIPWLVLARTGRSPLQQLAGAAARTLDLPRKLGWQPSRLLVTTFPVRRPDVAGSGGPHGGKYMIVGADGQRDAAVIVPASNSGSLVQRTSFTLMTGLVGMNLPQGSRPGSARRIPPPKDIDEVFERMEGSVNDGMVEILKHVTADPMKGDQTSWTVLIRGTKAWTSGGGNPQDMLTNLQEVAGITSDQSHAVRAAMELAGIDENEPVELVGHSQGGIVATNLAADRDFMERFQVASVLTAGSPVALAPVTLVRSLHLENLADPVPALDGKANRADRNRLTVYFSPDHAPEGSSAHGVETYREAAASLEAGAGNSDAVTSWLQRRRETLGLRADTRTVSTEYWVQRVS